MAAATAAQVAVGPLGQDRLFADLQNKRPDVRQKAASELRDTLVILLRGMYRSDIHVSGNEAGLTSTVCIARISARALPGPLQSRN